MLAIWGAQGRIKDKAYFHHIYDKVKKRSKEKNQIIQSNQDVHMCVYDGFCKVDTRPGMGAGYYHIYDECCGDGKVDTRPRMGASYYHLICWNSFFMIPSLSFPSLFSDMGYPFFIFPFSSSCFEHVSLFFFHSSCLFFKDTFGERSHHT
jgi:hypothetical protein